LRPVGLHHAVVVLEIALDANAPVGNSSLDTRNPVPRGGKWYERVTRDPDVEVAERSIARERLHPLRRAPDSKGERELRRREELDRDARRQCSPVAARERFR